MVKRSKSTNTDFDSDRPVKGRSSDRLGFAAIAERLAKTLLSQAAVEGFVVGVEGSWGSGKSSIVNLLAEALRKKRGPKKPEIVYFAPWLIGQRDALVTDLILQIAAAVDRIQGSTRTATETATSVSKELGQKLRGYASKVGRVTAPLAALAGLAGVPGTELLSRLLKGASEAADALDETVSVETLRNDIVDQLSQIGHRIIVIIDDLDRLEPAEAAEITRLIRAVTDFPNVVYVLCYDRGVLARSLETALSIGNGSAYLDKIVQVNFRVPQPEAFDLRRWLFDDCVRLFSATTAMRLDQDATSQLYTICDLEGGSIDTPRDVVQILNALRLYWPPIKYNAYFPDLVWLKIINIKDIEFYHWIERYMVQFSALAGGHVRIIADEKKRFAKELDKFSNESDDVSTARSIWTIKDYVPGIDIARQRSGGDMLFNILQPNIALLEAGKRLGSPQHYRYYFAFSKPSGSLDDAQLQEFVTLAANDESAAAALFMQLAKSKRPQGGTVAELLMDRLRNLQLDGSPEGAAQGIVKVFANVLDEAALDAGEADWGKYWIWERSVPMLKDLFKRIPTNEHNALVTEIFGEGRAIGWLMNVIRRETFAHGRYGTQERDPSDWIFSEEEFDLAVRLFLERIKGRSRSDVINAPSLLSFMFGWMQAGDEEGVKAWANEQITSNEAMLNFLNKCRSWLESGKVMHPIKRNDMERFLDFETIETRLRAIKEDQNAPEGERKLAKELLEAIRIGDEHSLD